MKKILIAGHRLDSRALKLAIGLSQKAQVYLLSGEYTHKELLSFFPWRWSLFRTSFEVTACVASCRPDLIVFYGDTSLRALLPECSIKTAFYFNDFDHSTIRACDNVDIVLAPSEQIAETVSNGAQTCIPCLPAVPLMLYPELRDPDLGGICHVGLIGKEPWRDFRYFAKRCQADSIPLFMYHGGNITECISFEYETCMDVIVRRISDYGALLNQMQRHDWSYCGCGIECPDCMTNKLFESIAAGVPVMVENMKAQQQFIKDAGIGIEVSESNMPRWAATDLRKRIMDEREKYSFENINKDVIAVLTT